ncbi:hypothetical protein FACS1894190_11950 [Spirochaetia bacterium]|nr:hypothetical protein FACS1894190_11950 [Spirochaetia bacterium]
MFIYPPIAKLPQKITDFYYDFLFTNTNKSGELYLLVFLTVLGIALVAWLDRKQSIDKDSEPSKSIYLSLVILPLLAGYFIHGYIPQFILVLGMVFWASNLVCPQYSLKSVLAYFLIYHACMGIITPLGKARITVVIIMSCVIFVPVFYFVFMKNKEAITLIDKIILGVQIFIPLCLFIFLKNKYLAGGEVVVIPFRRRYVYLITSIIIISTAYAIFRFVKSFRHTRDNISMTNDKINNLVLLSTLCIISAFHVDINVSRFVPEDFHHFGERVISWQQIIELDRIPYKEFFAPSGLFSIVNGFFLHTLFDGTASSILPALTFEQAFYAVLIAIAFSLAAGPFVALFVIYLLPIMSYERFHLIFFSLALLAVPGIWKDINRWLKVWGLLVVVNMLNYPLFGMSLAVGALPYACTGIYLAIKQKKFLAWFRKPSFYITWLIEFAVIIPFVPLLLRMVTTSAISGGGTVQADGRALFTNDLSIPNYLLGVSDGYNYLARIFQYTVVLTGLALAIIIPAYILIRTLKSKMTTEEKLSSPLFYFSTLCLFFLPAAYTFGVIRLDDGSFNRASGPIGITAVLCIIALLKYSKSVFTNKENLSLVIIILTLALPSPWIYGRLNSLKNISKINVPENTVRISDDINAKIPRLGKGFINQGNLDSILYQYNFLDKNNLWGYDYHSGYLDSYILNAPVPGSGQMGIAGGYKLARLYYTAFKDKPVVLRGLPQTYLWYWAALDKGLVQTPEGFWVTPELIKDKYSPDELRRPEHAPAMGLYPSAYGRSLKSLRPILDSVRTMDANNTGEIIPLGIKGTEADYIYLELETEAIIQNRYFEAWDFSKYGIRFNFKHNGQWDFWDVDYGDGRLLLPAGDDTRWLYDDIEEINVELTKGFNSVSRGKLKIELLKLNRYR